MHNVRNERARHDARCPVCSLKCAFVWKRRTAALQDGSLTAFQANGKLHFRPSARDRRSPASCAILLLARRWPRASGICVGGSHQKRRRATAVRRRTDTWRRRFAPSARGHARDRRASAARPSSAKSWCTLGQALAFDPILSGNRNMACMTCHLPAFATGDGKNLSIGEGGIGLGTNRTLGRGVFIPRNAPPLFNLAGLNQLFWDGRVSVDAAGAFHTPANTQVTPAMTQVFEFGAASAIGLFPVTSRTEMRGQNNIAITTGGSRATSSRRFRTATSPASGAR